jgi:hypothetical protein
MIRPVTGFSVRGALWYQGESNRNEPDRYAQLMQGLIENWRAEWGIEEMPFITCKLLLSITAHRIEFCLFARGTT